MASLYKMSLGKKLLFMFIPLILILLGGEIAQRIRYYVRSGETLYLTYGINVKRLIYIHGGIENSPKNEEEAQKEVEVTALRMASFEEMTDPELGPGMYLRGRFFPYAKGSSTLRVAAVGSSTTFGAGFDDETYPVLLEKELNAALGDSGLKAEVINFGVPGQNTEHACSNLKNVTLRFDPDLVIIYMGMNDSSTKAYSYLKRSYSLLPIKLARFLFTHSLLYVTALEKYSFWMGKKPENIKANAENYVNNIDKMVVLCKEKHVDCLIIPEVGKFDRITQRSIRYLNYQEEMKEIKKFASDDRCMYLEVFDTLLTEQNETYFQDWCHLYPVARRKLAQRITSYLVQSGWLQSKTAALKSE